MRLSVRILLGYFLIVGLAGLLILRAVVEQLQPVVRETIEEVMVDSVHLLAEVAVQDFVDGQFTNEQFGNAMSRYAKREVQVKIWHFEKVRLDFDVYITDKKGKVVFDSTGKWLGKDFSQWRNVNRALKGEYGARSTREVAGDDRSSVYHVSAPILQSSTAEATASVLGTVTLAKSVNSVDPIIEKARKMVVFQGTLLILAALVTGLLITWRLQIGIKKLLDFAAQAAQGQTVDPPKIRTTELNWLAQAMAKMRDELKGKRYMEQYTQGLAHELKSPLSAITASSEFLADDTLSAADRARFSQLTNEQIVKMRHSIDQMLAAARIENLTTLENQSVFSATELVQECIVELNSLSIAKNISIQFTPDQPQNIRGDRALITLAVANLLSNAMDFSPTGSAITVNVSTSLTLQRQRFVEITILDQGTGIPPFAVNRVYERFFSLPRPDGRKGSGLGLSLAAQVAALHGGTISVTNTELGGCLAALSVPSFT